MGYHGPNDTKNLVLACGVKWLSLEPSSQVLFYTISKRASHNPTGKQTQNDCEGQQHKQNLFQHAQQEHSQEQGDEEN
jgi:hypothetical protein